MDPAEALDHTITAGLLIATRPGPGGVVQRMDKAHREALSRLTSDELAKVRLPEHVCRTGGRRGRASLR